MERLFWVILVSNLLSRVLEVERRGRRRMRARERGEDGGKSVIQCEEDSTYSFLALKIERSHVSTVVGLWNLEKIKL